MKKTFILVLLFMCAVILSAQETVKISPFSGSVEFTTKYLWRGQEYGEAPAFFPTLNYSIGDFSVYATGAYTFDKSWREADLGLSYSFKGLTVGIVDYFYPTPVGQNDNYFNFKSDETGHLLEGCITYEPSFAPVSILISTFFYGADKNLEGKQAWSSYAELGYHHEFKDESIISVALGASLNKSQYNNFETGFSIVNIAAKYQRDLYSKERISIPASVQFVVNPQKQKNYLAFSLGLNF